MIYEMRTDTFAQNNDAVDFVQKLGEVIEHRNTFSPLGALWLSEIGTLNQVIHVWPYEDLQHRNEVRAVVAKDGNWPPPGITGLLGEDVEILNPVPFMRPWEGVQELGSFYEVRSYVCKPGSIREMVRLVGRVHACPRGVLSAGSLLVHRVWHPVQVGKRLALCHSRRTG